MVEPKGKLLAKKVAAPKAKSKTAVADTKKPVVKSVATVKKKVVTKKKVAEIVQEKKIKTPVAKKVSATTEKAKAPAKKVATTKVRASSQSGKGVSKPTPEERYRMIETAAYFIAEQHGFQGRSDAHWAAAERQIASALGE